MKLRKINELISPINVNDFIGVNFYALFIKQDKCHNNIYYPFHMDVYCSKKEKDQNKMRYNVDISFSNYYENLKYEFSPRHIFIDFKDLNINELKTIFKDFTTGTLSLINNDYKGVIRGSESISNLINDIDIRTEIIKNIITLFPYDYLCLCMDDLFNNSIIWNELSCKEYLTYHTSDGQFISYDTLLIGTLTNQKILGKNSIVYKIKFISYFATNIKYELVIKRESEDDSFHIFDYNYIINEVSNIINEKAIKIKNNKNDDYRIIDIDENQKLTSFMINLLAPIKLMQVDCIEKYIKEGE